MDSYYKKKNKVSKLRSSNLFAFIQDETDLRKSPPSRIWTSDLEISDFEPDLQSPALPTELSVVGIFMNNRLLYIHDREVNYHSMLLKY